MYMYLFNNLIFWHFNDLYVSPEAIPVEAEVITGKLTEDEQQQFIVVTLVCQIVGKCLESGSGT